MNPKRWAEIERLYHAALEKPSAERQTFLATMTVGDLDLLREVESLLRHRADADHLLEKPAWRHLDAAEGFAPGTRIGPYEIIELLGCGGMGEVYKSIDSRLKRTVAIKSIRQGRGATPEDSLRFIAEARAASALNHPNIVQIHELESHDGNNFLVMEFVRGKTLAQVVRDEQLAPELVVDYAAQIASALAAAHAAGIVHRDIKPGNIMLGEDGRLKLLDFGLAKRVRASAAEAGTTMTSGPETGAHSVLGTAGYMSPEQAEGKPVDARSDVFSTGAVLYEMLTGQRAFDGDSTMAVLYKVLHETPPAVRERNPRVPKPLSRIVARCLEKDPALRFASGSELAVALDQYRRASTAVRSRQRMYAAIAALTVIFGGMAAWSYYRYSRARWARNVAVPQVRDLINNGDYVGAFDLLESARKAVPDDPAVKQHWSEIALPIHLNTTPEGATVSYRRYGDAKGAWHVVGKTPLPDTPVPTLYITVRLEKAGYETQEFPALALLLQKATIPMWKTGSVPAGMLPVAQKAPWAGPGARAPLPDYFLDKYEVTNEQFQQFANSGGYANAKYWRQPFVKNGRALSFEDAVAGFRDKTGRPGPADWELGRFPKDRANYPVTGISWFEAAAYCEYAGKALPTVNHWTKATGQGISADILMHSNIGGAGPAPVGSFAGVAAFGHYDLFGNAKEWGYNELGDGMRTLLGGGWNDGFFRYVRTDADDSFARGASYGCRCASYPAGPTEEALQPVRPRPIRDYSKEQPVDDATFATLCSFYEYDRGDPLETKVESVDDSNPGWRTEKISFRAAYGRQRVPAFVYVPKNSKPPYQAVLWVPGGYAYTLRSSQNGIRSELFNFLMTTGRVVIHPIYQGTYERRVEDEGPNEGRNLIIQFINDARRAIDYLASRPDIDRERLAYFSVSDTEGPMILALEPRIKAAMFVSSGLWKFQLPREVDPFQFARRVHTPALLINSRHDFQILPQQYEALLKALATPAENKRLVLFDFGHVPYVNEIQREVLDWLDRYLGPVGR